ncbi:MAG: hypothetical protein ABR577_18490 [Pyrinomonadaceae bacterium]
MKLRIRGNSLRLRLTKPEVARIAEGLPLEETIMFGLEPHQRLSYALECSDNGENITADYRDGHITVRLPQSIARKWATTDQISINGEQTLDGGGATLRLLIEKDFACLTERRGAEDADTFPHPLEGVLQC